VGKETIIAFAEGLRIRSDFSQGKDPVPLLIREGAQKSKNDSLESSSHHNVSKTIWRGYFHRLDEPGFQKRGGPKTPKANKKKQKRNSTYPNSNKKTTEKGKESIVFPLFLTCLHSNLEGHLHWDLR